MPAASPFVARLGAALGLETAAAARLVEQLAAALPAWLRDGGLAGEVDVRLMLQDMPGFAIAGRSDSALAAALESARVLERDTDGQFAPTASFFERMEVTRLRQERDRNRQRRTRADRIVTQAHASVTEAGPERDTPAPSRARATSSSSSSSSSTSDLSDRDFVRHRATAHGVRLNVHLVNLLLDYLRDWSDCRDDVDTLLKYAFGASNKVGYIEHTLRAMAENRRFDAARERTGSRAPPAGPYDEIDPSEFDLPANVRFIDDRRLP